METAGLRAGPDGAPRCFWHGGVPEYVRYHDEEWGRPIASDTRLFEKICLEGFQSGLSWLTILRKRENFRAAFAGFDIAAVARFGDKSGQHLIHSSGGAVDSSNDIGCSATPGGTDLTSSLWLAAPLLLLLRRRRRCC